MWTRLLLVGTFACAALPARADLIYACVNNSSGTIKIVAQADVCPTNSAKTSLSTTAPEPPPSSDVYAERIHPPIEFTSGGNAAVVAELVDLPPGQYLLLAHISEIDSSPPGTNIASVVCTLDRSGGPPTELTYSVLTGVSAGMSLTGTVTLDTTETISVSCSGTLASANGLILVHGAQLFAHAVGTIHEQGH